MDWGKKTEHSQGFCLYYLYLCHLCLCHPYVWSWLLFVGSFVLSMLTLNHLIFLIKQFSTLMAWFHCGLKTGTGYCLMVQIRKPRPGKTALGPTAAVGRTQPGVQVHLLILGIAVSSQFTNDPTPCPGSHQQEHTQLHLRVRSWLWFL